LDLRQYTRLLRAHWLLIATSVVVCVAGASAFAFTRTPVYEARSQLFVSNGVPANLSDAYVGSLFTQQRVVSYALLMAGPAVAQGVINDLGLPETVQQLQDKIRVSVPSGTVLIDLTVKDRSPQRAEDIAAALDRRFAGLVNTLETTQQGQKSSVKVSVTSPPQLPTQPISPRKSLFVLLGALLGLVLGVGGAVLREAFRRRIRDGDEAKAVAGVPVLGHLLKPSNDPDRLVALHDPMSGQAEAYRRLRTNLGPLGSANGLRTLVVSSVGDDDGTAEVAANLGVVLAQAGHSVLLVDANLRRPELAELMGLFAPLGGLSSVLKNDLPLEMALRSVADNLPIKVLGSAPLLSDRSGLSDASPSDLLASPRFEAVLAELSRLADIIIFDAPPLLAATDAAVLARLTSGVLLVTRAGTTTVDQLESAVEALRAVNAKLVGLVMRRTRGGLR